MTYCDADHVMRKKIYWEIIFCLCRLTASLLLKTYHGGHVVIRMSLGGATNRPFYRIVAAYNKRARDSKYIEQLGSYDPLPNIYNEKLVSFNYDRIKYWIGCGAHPTKPVAKLLGEYMIDCNAIDSEKCLCLFQSQGTNVITEVLSSLHPSPPFKHTCCYSNSLIFIASSILCLSCDASWLHQHNYKRFYIIPDLARNCKTSCVTVFKLCATDRMQIILRFIGQNFQLHYYVSIMAFYRLYQYVMILYQITHYSNVFYLEPFTTRLPT